MRPLEKAEIGWIIEQYLRRAERATRGEEVR